MDHTKGLIEEAKKLEERAAKLRAAAAILNGTPKSKTRTKKHKSARGRIADVVELLKKEPQVRISQISKRLGIAKPTIYLWLKKNDTFVNNEGVVSLKNT